MARTKCQECKRRLSARDAKDGVLLCDACSVRIDTMFASLNDDDALSCMNVLSKVTASQPMLKLPKRVNAVMYLECLGGKWDGRSVGFRPVDVVRMKHLLIGESERSNVVDVYRRRDDSFLHHVGQLSRHDAMNVAGPIGGCMATVQSLSLTTSDTEWLRRLG